MIVPEARIYSIKGSCTCVKQVVWGLRPRPLSFVIGSDPEKYLNVHRSKLESLRSIRYTK